MVDQDTYRRRRMRRRMGKHWDCLSPEEQELLIRQHFDRPESREERYARRRKLIRELAEVHTVAEIAKTLRISKATVYRELRASKPIVKKMILFEAPVLDQLTEYAEQRGWSLHDAANHLFKHTFEYMKALESNAEPEGEE